MYITSICILRIHDRTIPSPLCHPPVASHLHGGVAPGDDGAFSSPLLMRLNRMEQSLGPILGVAQERRSFGRGEESSLTVGCEAIWAGACIHAISSLSRECQIISK
jgi:hypothetical protein